MANKKGFCVAPFRNAEFFHSGEVWQCVSGGWNEKERRWVNAWITTGPSGNVLKGDNFKEIWNGETAQKLRRSMHDRTLEFCDPNECGFLNRWNKEDIDESVYDNGYFPIYNDDTFHKLWNAKEINPFGEKKWKEIIDNKLTDLPYGPECVIFSHDRSCNLKCPSCRTDFIQTKGEERSKSEFIQDQILSYALDDANELYITASGDAFGGSFWRDLLKSLTLEKYPNAHSLHIHTNGNGWTRKMWDYLDNLKKLPRITAEISIDSCSKEVYEEIRLGGNWKRLTNNLHFIFTDIPNLDFVRLTFVTQDTNYHEMVGYAEMADYYQKLNGMRTEVNYIHINNWGTYTPDVFKKKAIASPNHPDHNKFLEELKKLEIFKKNTKNLEIFTNF